MSTPVLSSPPSAASGNGVHKTIPGFTALYEGAVDWSACGQVANEVFVAALGGRKPDVGLAKEAVARDITAGRMNRPGEHGQYLSDIAWDLGQRGVKQLDIIPYSATPNLDALHMLIKNACLAGVPVIIQVSRAYNLPDNEAGVAYHFVVLGGIDSDKGYLVANGDTRTAIAQRGTWPPLNWATWSQLAAAGICGAIAVHPTTPPAPPAPPPPPSDVQAEIDALKASVAQIASQAAQAGATAQEAQSLAQHLQAALRAV